MPTIPTETVAPSREDPVVAALSPVFGGIAGPRRRPPPSRAAVLRVLIAFVIIGISFGVVEKQPCRSGGWSTPAQFFHGCYSDLPLVYETSGLAEGTMPYLEQTDGQYLAQPILSGLTMWGLAQIVPAGDHAERWFFDLATVLIAILALALVTITMFSAPRQRPWDAALVAACPLLALSALVSLDLLGVTLTAGGLLLWGKSRPAAAGFLLGLAIAARTYPIVVVLAIGLLALRAGRLSEWTITLLATCLTVITVILPWLALNPDGIRATYRGWISSATGYGSPWLLPQLVFGESARLPVVVTTSLSVIGMVGSVVFVGWLALGSTRRPAVAQLCFVAVAIVVITGKSWPVQTSLWLLPLAALALPRWRDHLVWLTTEALYFMAVWLKIAAETTADRGLPDAVYAVFLGLRIIGVLWLIWRVRVDLTAPTSDRLRHRPDGIDPLDGPLAGAKDALVLHIR
jgi:uncharacterized membrane protein